MPARTHCAGASSPEALPPLIVICGATATGKTALSLRLADALTPTAVISADSRQVYRGMDIGTAKVGAADRARHRHFGLDLVEPGEPFSVAEFVLHARRALASQRRAEPVILVGGSGLYVRAVARGIPVDETGRNEKARAELEARLVGEGVIALARELTSVAPGVAARTDLGNPRRVVRALERVQLAGDQAPPAALGYPGRVLWLGLTAEPAEHRAWIEARARGQFESGLLDEAASLRTAFDESARAFTAVGYHEAFDVLAGRATRAEAIATTAQRTWRYARRQRTWFRREPDVVWLPAGAATSVAMATDLARAFLKRSP